jgi:beta-phosphoglucomutase-like phosphatase (HAD superfamily)
MMIDGERGPHLDLRLPARIRACLFDLDGVLIETTAVHAAAWKSIFDAFLRTRAREHGIPFVPFDLEREYSEYIDGRQRDEGVRRFLEARGVTLPDGEPNAPCSRHTVVGLARSQSKVALAFVREHGVQPYSDAVRYLQAARKAGLRTAVVSSCDHARVTLEMAGIGHLFDEQLDSTDAERMLLRSTPAPDTLLAVARALWVFADEVAVFAAAPDALKAARLGGFGHVVGIDRRGHPDRLREHGTDAVASDLRELIARR